MKVSVSHPGVPPFARQVAKALHEEDLLEYYFTTFIADRNSAIQNFMVKSARLFNYDLEKQLTRRKLDEIPDSKIRRYQFGEIVRTLCDRFGVDSRAVDFIFDFNIKRFAAHVGRNLEKTEAIYGYEYCCLETFDIADKRGIKRIYDVPSPEHDFVSEILKKEYDKFENLQTPHFKYTSKFQAERTERRRNEWNLADIVIANSEFTKKSFEYAGLDVSKVRVVPYGCPEVIKKKNLKNPAKGEINFLWAGTFSIRKGAHYLLEALNDLNPEKYTLNVYGAWEIPGNMDKKTMTSVNVSKTVPYEQLRQAYIDSDVLIFPTICDGFGMVISEALSHGVPVITTNRAGGADLIENGYNGFVIDHSSSESISEIMNWFLNKPEKLFNMKENALLSAEKWQWSDYRKGIISALET